MTGGEIIVGILCFLLMAWLSGYHKKPNRKWYRSRDPYKRWAIKQQNRRRRW